MLNLEPLIATDPASDLDDFYPLALNALHHDGRLKALPSEFVDQIGDQAYDACLAAIERATPVDHGLYVIADRYLGQAMLDILENGESVETALSEAQTTLEAGP